MIPEPDKLVSPDDSGDESIHSERPLPYERHSMPNISDYSDDMDDSISVSTKRSKDPFVESLSSPPSPISKSGSIDSSSETQLSDFSGTSSPPLPSFPAFQTNTRSITFPTRKALPCPPQNGSSSTINIKAELKYLQRAQKDANNYDQWKYFSLAIDAVTGQEDWKNKDASVVYDYELVESRLRDLRAARESGNTALLLYLVRTTYCRNLGNMGDHRLYRHCQSGTKHLIERYIQECELALDSILKNAHGRPDILSTLVETRKAFGSTALVLSGGSVMGFLHAGVARELVAHGLLPKIISGTSAGSIFASLLCIYREEEYGAMWAIAENEVSIFEPVGQAESFASRLKRFLTIGTWIDSTHLKSMLQDLLGDVTFQEAYNRTGRILNVTVSVKGSHDMPRLLNYLTAPNVLIWSAVVCSCSVPYVFAADSILAVDPISRKLFPWTQASFMDGSVENDMPLSRLTEMFNVNHFVACQVNPHIAPLVPKPQDSPERKLPKRGWLTSKIGGAFRAVSSFVADEIQYNLSLLNEAGIGGAPVAVALNLLLQDYYGDVTIVPPIYPSDLKTLLRNPSPLSMDEMIKRGARTTWPQLAIIRNHCAVELALDRAIVEMRAQCIRTIALKIPNTETRKPRKARAKSVSAPWHDGRRKIAVSLTHMSPRPAKIHES